jgi:hypothetical protein
MNDTERRYFERGVLVSRFGIAYEMDPDFRKDLNNVANAFEARFGSTATATAEYVSANAETASNLRQMNVAVRTLDGIVKNKYTNNPTKLAAWISASHVEKAPKKKETPTP